MLKNLLLIIVIILCRNAFSQDKDSTVITGEYSVKIDTIIIRGNYITEDFIILRELTFKQGDTLTSKQATYNKERVYSLDIFNQVKIYPVSVHNKIIAVIDVVESWYIWPIPFAELKNGDWNKISYGIDLAIKNFRGMNETVRINAGLGYDPSLTVDYIVPVLNYNENIYLDTRLSYNVVENKSLTAQQEYGAVFDQKMIDAQITIGKRINLFHNITFTTGYDYVETPLYFPGINASDKRIDRVLFVGAGYAFDTRDLAQFPKNGIYSSLGILMKGLGLNDINYQIYTFDFREYRPLFWDISGKWRFTTRLTSGKSIPYYDYSVLGYQERIRGYLHDVLEGNDYFLTSLEFFHPLIKDIDLNFDFIPIVPKQFLSYRVALYTEIFGDAGAVKQRIKSLGIRDFDSGYGFGFTMLILPYNILRIELALNDKFNSEIVLDLGLSF
ncbi:MAG: BamA/TamA family outer membrane protein [Ignavibacteriaceae bacterium]|nr:BamA/TamA family outer membrane protein [Ignavibacteriaceae bacterium]